MQPVNYHEFPERLIKALMAEMNSREYLRNLTGLAQENGDKKIISDIIRDEDRHFDNLTRLYVESAGVKPVLQLPGKQVIPDYKTGIRTAIMYGIEAYRFYRDAYLVQQAQDKKNMFFEAMTDENEHVLKLNYIFTGNIQGRE